MHLMLISASKTKVSHIINLAVIHEIWKFIIYNKINKRMRHFYRVSHIEVCKVNQLWGVKRSIIFLKYGDPHGLITPSTQMTNTSPFLWNGSSNIQFFTDIFLWEAVETSRYFFFENWLMKHKSPNLLKPLGTII